MLDQIEENNDSTKVEKLVRAFDLVMQTAVTRSEKELEMALAMEDKETAAKERIKLNTLQMTWMLFEQCQSEIIQSQESFFLDLYAV